MCRWLILALSILSYSGATAIAPGYKRVTADVSAPTSPKSVARLDLSNIQSAAGDVMDVDGESPVSPRPPHISLARRAGRILPILSILPPSTISSRFFVSTFPTFSPRGLSKPSSPADIPSPRTY